MRSYVEEAVQAARSGREPLLEYVEPEGCSIDRFDPDRASCWGK